jgi:hypothetical protein
LDSLASQWIRRTCSYSRVLLEQYAVLAANIVRHQKQEHQVLVRCIYTRKRVPDLFTFH